MATKRDRERRKVSANRRLKEHKTGFDRTAYRVPEGVTMFIPKKPGVYRLEIIPYEVTDEVKKFQPDLRYADPGDLHYERTFWTHRNIGPNNDTYVCPAKTFNKPCPVCEHRSQLAKSSKKEDEELVKSLAPKERQLFNVYDHGDPSKGVQLWDMSYFLFGKHLDNKINNADEDDREAYGLFADPEDGKTLRVTATEESNPFGKHLEFADIEFKDRKEQLDQELYDKAVNLDELIQPIEYKKLKDIFLQTAKAAEEEEEGDEDKEAPPKKAESRNGKKLQAQAEEEEAEGPEDEVESELTADDLGIEVGGKVKHKEHGVCTVVHVSGDGTSLRLKDAEGEVYRGVAPAECKKAKGEEKAPPPPAKKPKPAPEEEEPGDDDDWGDDEPEEEEEEKTPPKKGGKKPAPKAEADDDDWGDDDGPEDDWGNEDAEDDPPKKPARGKK